MFGGFILGAVFCCRVCSSSRAGVGERLLYDHHQEKTESRVFFQAAWADPAGPEEAMVEDNGNNHQGSLLPSGELQLLCLGVCGEITFNYTLYFRVYV